MHNLAFMMNSCSDAALQPACTLQFIANDDNIELDPAVENETVFGCTTVILLLVPLAFCNLLQCLCSLFTL